MIWIIVLIALLGLGIFIWMKKKTENRRYDQQERLEQRKEEFLKMLEDIKNKNDQHDS